MPFTTADVEKHTKKATTDKLKRQWVGIANSALKRCDADDEKCEASAIRQANGVIAKRVEETVVWQDVGQIANSAIEVGLALANDSGEITSERADKVLRKWEVELGELWQDGEPLADFDNTLPDELGEAVWTRKFINDLPDSSFAIILPGGKKDGEGKTTPRNLRKLPYKDAGGKVDVAHLRNALARLPQTKGLSDAQKSSARSKLEAAAKKHLTTHQEKAMFDADKIRNLLTEALSMLEESDTMEGTGQAVEVARDATEEDTANLSESEAAVIETGRRAPVIVDFQILQPGPGNSRDNRYYPADVVERDIHVFEGVDVFATDHQEKERSERTKVGTVLACPSFFTESRAPVASVLLYDPNQAEKARNRADSDSLGTLECSILGTGQVKDGKIDGKEYKIVEAITQGRYLELVSKAGAGGRALNLAEVESPGGDDMTEETTVAPVEKVEEVEIEEADTGEQEPQMLDGEVVKEALGKTNLPTFVQVTLAEREYSSDSELQAAIEETTAEVKKLTGSGLVVNLGATQTVEPELSLEETEQRRKDEFNKIMVEVGLQPV